MAVAGERVRGCDPHEPSTGEIADFERFDVRLNYLVTGALPRGGSM
jgi:hypothetical protein